MSSMSSLISVSEAVNHAPSVKPRLVDRDYAKALADMGRIDELEALYIPWVKTPEYLVFKGENTHDPSAPHRFKASLMAKRGNKAYRLRVNKRLDTLKKLPNIQWFDYKDVDHTHKTQGVYVTLTLKRWLPCGEMWEKIGELWAEYADRLDKRYDGVEYFRVFEAQRDGTPHVHALLFFKSAEFTAFYYNDEWRVDEKKDLEWEHGHVDVVALSSVQGGFSYLRKYLGKLHQEREVDEVDNKSGFNFNLTNRTLTLMWAFRKRSYSITKRLGDLIRHLHNSDPPKKLHEVDLDLKPLWKWVLVGFWAGDLGRWVRDLSIGEYRALKGSPSWSSRCL